MAVRRKDRRSATGMSGRAGAAAPRTVRPPDSTSQRRGPAGDRTRADPAACRDHHGRQRPVGQGPRPAAHRGSRARGGGAARRRQRRPRAGHPVPSAYAFSTENWKRSPDEVRFLMGFNRDVIRRRRDELNEKGVRVRWVGRAAAAVGQRHRRARGGRGADRAATPNDPGDVRQLRGPRRDRRCGRGHGGRRRRPGGCEPDQIDEELLAHYLDEPDMPDVDLFIRSSGEQRTSNFLLWQSAYAEMVFLDTLWPDFDRRHLWHACQIYASRDRRYGGRCPTSRPADHDLGRSSPRAQSRPASLSTPRPPCRWRSPARARRGSRGRATGQDRAAASPGTAAIGRSSSPAHREGRTSPRNSAMPMQNRDEEPRQRRRSAPATARWRARSGRAGCSRAGAATSTFRRLLGRRHEGPDALGRRSECPGVGGRVAWPCARLSLMPMGSPAARASAVDRRFGAPPAR